MRLRLLAKRTLWLPTWQGWILLCLAAGGVFVAGILNIHPFLAVTETVPAEIFVVEGWLSDDALARVVDAFAHGNYKFLCTTGGPLPHGLHLSQYKDFAHLAAASLLVMGIDEDRLIVAPAPYVATNRTFESARSLRAKLVSRQIHGKGLNIFTAGVHARRSRMVYRKVFGSGVRVGVIAHPSASYDPDRWWNSSEGLKAVVGETLSCSYEWLLDSGRSRDAAMGEKGHPWPAE